MMIILWVTSLYRPRCAGSEIYTEGVCKELAAQGHEVHVMTNTRSENGRRITQDAPGVKVWRTRRMADFLKLGDEIGAQAVITQYEWARACLQQSPVPVAVVLHNRWSVATIPQYLRANCALWIVNSPITREETDIDEVRTGDSAVLVPPLDAMRFEGARDATGDRVGVLGLSKEKGGELFWEIARRMPDTQFLAQRGGYGIQRVESLPNVEVLPTGDVRDLFRRSKIFLFPTQFDSFGMAGLESQYCGVPVIASDLPSLRYSLGDDGAVFLGGARAAQWEADIRRLLSAKKSYRDLADRGRMNAKAKIRLHSVQVRGVASILEGLANGD